MLINEEILVNYMNKDLAVQNVDISEKTSKMMEEKKILKHQINTPLYNGALINRLLTILFSLYL